MFPAYSVTKDYKEQCKCLHSAFHDAFPHLPANNLDVEPLIGVNKAIWIWLFLCILLQANFQEIGHMLLRSHLCPLPVLWNSETTSTFLPLQKLFLPRWWPKRDSSHTPICTSCSKTGDYNEHFLRLLAYLGHTQLVRFKLCTLQAQPPPGERGMTTWFQFSNPWEGGRVHPS